MSYHSGMVLAVKKAPDEGPMKVVTLRLPESVVIQIDEHADVLRGEREPCLTRADVIRELIIGGLKARKQKGSI